jgi:hypothetical protein
MDHFLFKWRKTKRTALTMTAFLLITLVLGNRIYHYACVSDVEPEVVKSLPMQIEVDGIKLIKTLADGEFEIQARRAQPGQELKLGPRSKSGGFVSLFQVQATLRLQGMERWTARGALARMTKDGLEFPKSAVVEPVQGPPRSYRHLRINLDTGRLSGER